MPSLLQIRTGRAQRVDGHVTAYGKLPRTGAVFAHALGLHGDEVADKRVHGGPEKAVYAYSADNYSLWVSDYPQHIDRLVPGGFGENLLIEGLNELSIHIGDRWRIGGALVEVCQPRQPCVTMARWFDDPKMVKAMVKNGRAGWYLRVLEDGDMQPGEIELEHRPQGAWSVAQVLAASYKSPPDPVELAALAQAPGLASGWARWAGEAAASEKPRAKPL